jgi:hypothetical protein
MATHAKRVRKNVTMRDKAWRENNTSEVRPFAPGIEAEVPQPRHHDEDGPDSPRSPGDQPDQKLGGRTSSRGSQPGNGSRQKADQKTRQEPAPQNPDRSGRDQG